MSGAPRYDRDGAGEWRMRLGPDAGPEILLVPPLLEEMNRCRALIAAMMRELAGTGFLCTLPDLPGTGESERGLETVSFDDWRAAVARTRAPALTVALRGGTLLDDAVDAPHWRFAPVAGASLIRDLERAERAGGARNGGYKLTDTLSQAIAAATPKALERLRVVRLSSDAQPADTKLEGPALWRRSEPGTAPELARALAADIRAWAGQCGIS